MADYTKFKFTDLGQRAITKVNGVLALLGVWYNQGAVITTEKVDINHVGEPYDQITYQVTNDIQVSNEAVITVNFPPDKTIDPESADDSFDADNNTDYSVIDNVPYNTAVDRIKILSYMDFGQLLFDGSNIYPNFEIFQYDFEKLIYSTLDGGGNPYQEIKYQVGNINGYNPTIYILQYNIPGFGILLPGDEVVEDDGTLTLQTNKMNITGGLAGKSFDFYITVALTPDVLFLNPDTELTIDYGVGTHNISANGSTVFSGILDNVGAMEIVSSLTLANVDFPVTGTISYTLTAIDDEFANVGTPNTIEININY